MSITTTELFNNVLGFLAPSFGVIAVIFLAIGIVNVVINAGRTIYGAGELPAFKPDPTQPAATPQPAAPQPDKPWGLPEYVVFFVEYIRALTKPTTCPKCGAPMPEIGRTCEHCGHTV